MSEPETRVDYVKGTLYHIKVTDLKINEMQPRKYFDEKAQNELTESIKSHGVLIPILFREEENGDLIIVSGERRLRAAKKAEIKDIPALLVEGNPDEIALIENLIRQDLTAVELAEALDRTKAEHKYSQVELASIIGKSETTVSEILSLMKLPDAIRDECRSDTTISRQTLLDISKKKKAEKMLKAFNKYKEKLQKNKPEKKSKRKKTWPEKFSSTCNDLKTIIKDKNFGYLEEKEKTNLISSIEELITEAKKWLEKNKPVQVEVADLEKPKRKLRSLGEPPLIEKIEDAEQ